MLVNVTTILSYRAVVRTNLLFLSYRSPKRLMHNPSVEKLDWTSAAKGDSSQLAIWLAVHAKPGKHCNQDDSQGSWWL